MATAIVMLGSMASSIPGSRTEAAEVSLGSGSNGNAVMRFLGNLWKIVVGDG